MRDVLFVSDLNHQSFAISLSAVVTRETESLALFLALLFSVSVFLSLFLSPSYLCTCLTNLVSSLVCFHFKHYKTILINRPLL